MLIDDLATYLQTNSVGTLGSSLFIGNMPDGTDNCVMVDVTGGVAPSKDVPIMQPTVQCLVRNTSFETGLTKIKAVRDLLHRLNDGNTLKSGGVDVMSCFAMQEPTHLGKDTNERHIFTCNFIFKLRE